MEDWRDISWYLQQSLPMPTYYGFLLEWPTMTTSTLLTALDDIPTHLSLMTSYCSPASKPNLSYGVKCAMYHTIKRGSFISRCNIRMIPCRYFLNHTDVWWEDKLRLKYFLKVFYDNVKWGFLHLWQFCLISTFFKRLC